jgi:hypothetical protein
VDTTLVSALYAHNKIKVRYKVKMNDISYIASLCKPITNKSSSRKVWSIDLETVWLPFFKSTNAMGNTSIPHEALGCPLRLAYNKDQSVKFSASGTPVMQVSKDISKAVKMVRDNFIAGLQSFAHETSTNHADMYNAEVTETIKAGKPISERDGAKLAYALAELERQAKAEEERNALKLATDQAVKAGIDHAESETANETETANV